MQKTDPQHVYQAAQDAKNPSFEENIVNEIVHMSLGNAKVIIAAQESRITLNNEKTALEQEKTNVFTRGSHQSKVEEKAQALQNQDRELSALMDPINNIGDNALEDFVKDPPLRIDTKKVANAVTKKLISDGSILVGDKTPNEITLTKGIVEGVYNNWTKALIGRYKDLMKEMKSDSMNAKVMDNALRHAKFDKKDPRL